MCGTCGCSDRARVSGPQRNGSDGHVYLDGDHGHGHVHDTAVRGHHDADNARTGTRVLLEQDVLAKNDALARENRVWLDRNGVFAVNLMSSPGAGKTTVLRRTLTELDSVGDLSVIEGDQETELDADRLRATGRPVVQINTGAGCHLDSEMLANGLRSLGPAPRSAVFIENVGNLVCPALFDLGEHCRVVITATTEGVDKPLKYPHIFYRAELVLLNKIDLVPYVDFDVAEFSANARRVNPRITVLETSATTGAGLAAWYEWVGRELRERVGQVRG